MLRTVLDFLLSATFELSCVSQRRLLTNPITCKTKHPLEKKCSKWYVVALQGFHAKAQNVLTYIWCAGQKNIAWYIKPVCYLIRMTKEREPSFYPHLSSSHELMHFAKFLGNGECIIRTITIMHKILASIVTCPSVFLHITSNTKTPTNCKREKSWWAGETKISLLLTRNFNEDQKWTLIYPPNKRLRMLKTNKVVQCDQIDHTNACHTAE